jgi:HAE1 family hydrophobic/amphiphilic exporter-1
VQFLGHVVTRRTVTFGVLALFGLGIFGVDRTLPAGFIPNEDQGQIYAIIQTPPGTTLERTNEVSRHLQEIARGVEGVESVSSLAGYEILTEGRGSNAGTCLINLRPWSERTHSVREIMHEIEEQTHDIGAVVEFFEPPSVPGYGAADGFAVRLLDLGEETDYQEFDQVNQEFMEALSQRPELTGLFTFFAANYPQYEIVIDNERAMQKGVSIGQALDEPRHPRRQHLRAGLHPLRALLQGLCPVAAGVPPHALGHPRPLRRERPWRDGALFGLHDPA